MIAAVPFLLQIAALLHFTSLGSDSESEQILDPISQLFDRRWVKDTGVLSTISGSG